MFSSKQVLFASFVLTVVQDAIGNPCNQLNAEYFDGKCFKVFWEKASYEEAQGNCSKTWTSGGRLAEPRTDTQFLFLRNLAKKDYPLLSATGIYLGGGRYTTRGNLTWSDGELVDLTTDYWYPMSPDNYLDIENCLEIKILYTTFGLNDAACYGETGEDETKFYACEYYIGDNCESRMPNSEYYEGQCFQINTDKKIWDDALKSCVEYGGFLAEPRTEDMFNFLIMLIDIMVGEDTNYVYLLGLSDENTEGDFRWLTDDATLQLDKWSAGEPNGGRKESQVVLNSQYETLLDVSALAWDVPYICQTNTTMYNLTFANVKTETNTLPNIQTDTNTLTNTQTETGTLPKTQTETGTLPNTQTETGTLPNTQTEPNTLKNIYTETNTLQNTQTFNNTYIAVMPTCSKEYNTTVTLSITAPNPVTSIVRITQVDYLGNVQTVTENEVGNIPSHGIYVPVTEFSHILSGISSAYVEIKSTFPVTVLMFHDLLSSSSRTNDISSTLIFPVSILSQNYFVMFSSALPQEKRLTVTALEDNTRVAIKIFAESSQSAVIRVGEFNFTQSHLTTVFLKKYETALVEVIDMSVAFIFGTKAIAVFTCTKLNIDGETSLPNFGLDMVIPADYMDTKYVTFPSWPQNPTDQTMEMIQILAMMDNTAVQIYDGDNNQTITLARAGDFRDISLPLSNFYYMESNVPVQVTRLTSDVAVGCAVQLFPYFLWRNEYSIMSPSLPQDVHTAVIFTIGEVISYDSNFKVTSKTCQPIQGTNLHGCIMESVNITAQNTVYTLSSSSPFVVYQLWIDDNDRTRSCLSWGVNESDIKGLVNFNGKAFVNQTDASCVFPTTVKDNVTTLLTTTNDIATRKPNEITTTAIDVLAKIEKFQKFINSELHIEVKDTSAYKRTKISIPDFRPSSTAIGLFGAALLGGVFGLILLADATRVVAYFTKMKSNLVE